MQKKSKQISGGAPGFLVDAILKVLRPLVRLLLSNQITYPMLIRMLKNVYVEVATNDFKVDDKPQTDSRISLLTGVHRKDVKKIRETDTAIDETPARASLGARVISAWTGEAKYLDKKGKPKALHRLARENKRLSFEGLVQSINKDIRPRAVLDEWLRLGVVRLDEKNMVWLQLEAYVPEKGFEDKVYYFGQNVADHCAAAVNNVTGESSPMLDRCIFSDSLSPDSTAKLKKIANDKGMQAIQAVNREAISLERKDVKKSGEKKRINFGIYFYEEKLNDDD